MPKLPNLNLNPYKLDLSRGVMESDGPDDHARMLQAIEAYKSANNGAHPTLQEAMGFGRSMVAQPRIKSMIFSEATAHVMQLTGHRGEAGQSVHFGTYTHDIGLKALSETLETLTYPIDFSKIKGADFAQFLTRWNMTEQRKNKQEKQGIKKK